MSFSAQIQKKSEMVTFDILSFFYWADGDPI
jgi:hypothetical protein